MPAESEATDYYYPHHAIEDTQPTRPPVATPPARPRREWGCLLTLLLLSGFGVALLVVSGPRLASFSAWSLIEKADRLDLALPILEAGVLAWPDSARLHDDLGLAYLAERNAPAALQQFRWAVTLDEQRASARNNLGVALLEAGAAQEAIPHLLAAIELDPGSARLLVNLGRAYQAAGLNEQAQDAYQQATRLEPELPAPWAGLGRLALERGDYALSLQAFTHLLEIDQANSQALLGLGLVHLGLQRPAEALPYIQMALRVDPANPVAHYYLGLAYHALGQPAAARGALEEALAHSIDPLLSQKAALLLSGLPASQQDEPLDNPQIQSEGGAIYPTP